MTSGRVVSDLMLPLWEEVLWPFLDAWDSVRLRTTSTQWNLPGRYGPYGELFFFPFKREPTVLRELIRFAPSIPFEAVKACALVGLLMMAEEDSWRTDSGSSFSLSSSSENNVGNGASRPHGELLFSLIQKKPDSEAFNSFIGDGFLVPELKGGSEASDDVQADNVSNESLYVIGLHGSGDKISLFLQDWEVAKVAVSCQKRIGHAVQRIVRS